MFKFICGMKQFHEKLIKIYLTLKQICWIDEISLLEYNIQYIWLS